MLSPSNTIFTIPDNTSLNKYNPISGGQGALNSLSKNPDSPGDNNTPRYASVASQAPEDASVELKDQTVKYNPRNHPIVQSYLNYRSPHDIQYPTEIRFQIESTTEIPDSILLETINNKLQELKSNYPTAPITFDFDNIDDEELATSILINYYAIKIIKCHSITSISLFTVNCDKKARLNRYWKNLICREFTTSNKNVFTVVPVTKRETLAILSFEGPVIKHDINYLNKFAYHVIKSSGRTTTLGFNKQTRREVQTFAPYEIIQEQHIVENGRNKIFMLIALTNGLVPWVPSFLKPIKEAYKIRFNLIQRPNARLDFCCYCRSIDHTRNNCIVAPNCKKCGSKKHSAHKCTGKDDSVALYNLHSEPYKEKN